jgi:hypothetical protein
MSKPATYRKVRERGRREFIMLAEWGWVELGQKSAKKWSDLFIMYFYSIPGLLWTTASSTNL